jgi:hypothetical protein
MSIEYVTLEEAKAHLRVTHSDDDQSIKLKIRAASSAVKNYMKEYSVYEPARDADEDWEVDSNYEPVIDEDSNTTRAVRFEVKAAVLILLQQLYDQEYNFTPGYLPDEVVGLLYPLRDPALA